MRLSQWFWNFAVELVSTQYRVTCVWMYRVSHHKANLITSMQLLSVNHCIPPRKKSDVISLWWTGQWHSTEQCRIISEQKHMIFCKYPTESWFFSTHQSIYAEDVHSMKPHLLPKGTDINISSCWHQELSKMSKQYSNFVHRSHFSIYYKKPMYQSALTVTSWGSYIVFSNFKLQSTIET